MDEDLEKSSEEVIAAAKKKAMSLLLYMDRTEKQLREKLSDEEYPPEAISEAVSYVKSFHYLDDARYAENYVRAKKDSKSAFEIKYELNQRGVSQELIENAILNGEICESETVKKLFLKKYGKKDLSDRKTYEKAMRYFGNKGFSYSDMKEGISGAISESESSSEQ